MVAASAVFCACICYRGVWRIWLFPLVVVAGLLFFSFFLFSSFFPSFFLLSLFIFSLFFFSSFPFSYFLQVRAEHHMVYCVESEHGGGGGRGTDWR